MSEVPEEARVEGGADGRGGSLTTEDLAGGSLTLGDAVQITCVVDTIKRVVEEECPEVGEKLPQLVGALTGAHFACVDEYQPRADGKKWRALLVDFSLNCKTAAARRKAREAAGGNENVSEVQADREGQ